MTRRIQTMIQTLEFCRLPRGKTNIMRKTNLNHAQLKAYLTFLISKKLLKRDSDKYVTTQKGRSFLKAITELKKALQNYKRTISEELARAHITTSSESDT